MCLSSERTVFLLCGSVIDVLVDFGVDGGSNGKYEVFVVYFVVV